MWELILQHVIIWSESEKSVSHSLFSHPILCDPMDYSPPGFSGHGILQARIWVGCHSLLQGIFPTQESSPSLLHCRQILCHLSHQRNQWFEVGRAQFILWQNVWSSISVFFFFFCLSPYTFNCFTFQFTSESLQCCPLLSPFTELIIEKRESSRKTSISALLTMPKHLIVWITINCGKFWKRWEYQTTWPASWETCILRNLPLEKQVRKQ